MERNQKKSKAFIITFIAVIVLLIGGYFIFKNSAQIFGTKNSEDLNKSFNPLADTRDPEDLSVIDGSGENTNTSTSTTGSNNTTSGGTNTSGNTGIAETPLNNSGSLGIGSGLSGGTGLGTQGGLIHPPLNPIPAPTTSGTTAAPTLGSLPTTSNNPTLSTSTPTPSPYICLDTEPLVFTDEEKVELEDLLRQYYLIAPGLKTADDLFIVESDIATNQALVNQANTLYNQCLTEKSSGAYTGPQATKDNPYYTSPVASGTPYYIADFSALEQLLKIW